MDYEAFYGDLQIKEKSISDAITKQQNIFKNITKSSAKGDLKGVLTSINALEALFDDCARFLREYKEQSEAFDAKEYMSNGEFAKQMLEYCENFGVDVKGDFPAYEMFPYKIKIDGDSQDIYIDGRRVPCQRPSHLVQDIKKSREKLMKAHFNAGVFLNELAEAYDKLSAIKRKEDGKKRNFDLSLKELYRFLAPMSRFRKDYDMRSYAFDLARLYASETEFTSDGRQYAMGPGRLTSQNIRILNKNGKEAWVGTITFYAKES